ncbi:MAG: caspase family protein [Alphaproteobacteria bacterium]|nr:caspase family protein [Alphaproteobacteria bacterium]
MIGVNYMENEPDASLEGAHNDVGSWSRAISRLQPAEQHVLLSPKEPDLQKAWTECGGTGTPDPMYSYLSRFNSFLRMLSVDTDEDTTVIIVFAGHSSWLPQEGSAPAEMGLAMRDARRGERQGHMLFSDLQRHLTEIADNSADVWLVLDTCGATYPSLHLQNRSFTSWDVAIPAREVPEVSITPDDPEIPGGGSTPSDALLRQYQNLTANGRVQVVLACEADQSAFEARFQGRPHGCFSWAATSLLDRTRIGNNQNHPYLKMPLVELLERTKGTMNHLGVVQRPNSMPHPYLGKVMFGQRQLLNASFNTLHPRQVSGGTSGLRVFKLQWRRSGSADRDAGLLYATAAVRDLDSSASSLPDKYQHAEAVPKDPTLKELWYRTGREYWHLDSSSFQDGDSLIITPYRLIPYNQMNGTSYRNSSGFYFADKNSNPKRASLSTDFFF